MNQVKARAHDSLCYATCWLDELEREDRPDFAQDALHGDQIDRNTYREVIASSTAVWSLDRWNSYQDAG